MSAEKTGKVEKALRAVRTLAGKGRDPSLVLDALDDLVAAALNAEVNEAQTQLYKKVLEQCRKMDHLEAEDFGSLCLCLLGDTVDQKIAEGLARFNKIKRQRRQSPGESQAGGSNSVPAQPQQPAVFAPQPPQGWQPVFQYSSPLPNYPPEQGGYGWPRRGRGRGRGGARSKACYGCREEGHFLDQCPKLKALRGENQ